MKKILFTKDQDRWVIEEVFDGKLNGFFLDTAAADGIQFNNTIALVSLFILRLSNPSS